MAYAIKFDLGGIEFNIDAPTMDDLMEDYSSAGGDPKWFLAQVQDRLPMIEQGVAANYATPASSASRSVAPADENWAVETTDEKPSKPQQTDPWDDAPVEDAKPARKRTAPSRPAAKAAGSDAELSALTETDRFGRQWTTGLPDAPDCDCGEPAARLKAKSQAGKPYTVFKCAKGAPGGDWREKCEYSEFPPR